jgi:hypothetical protein
MVIKSLIRYKKRVRYQLTAHPLFIFYGFFLKSLLLYDPEMESLLLQGSLDFLYMFRIASLHGESEYAGIHLVAIGRTVVMNTGDVSAKACDDGCYLNQFAWLIVKLHLDGAETAALDQATKTAIQHQDRQSNSWSQ